MARRTRTQVALSTTQRQALESARQSLGLESLAATAEHLLTACLVPYIQQESGNSAQNGVGVSGIHMDSERVPSGTHVVPNRIPPVNTNQEDNLNYNQEEGESEGGKIPGGVQVGPNGIPPGSGELYECLGMLKSTTGYSFDINKDLGFVSDLIAEFPVVDPIETVKRLKTSALSNPLTKRNGRMTLRTYFKKAESFGQVRKELPYEQAIDSRAQQLINFGYRVDDQGRLWDSDELVQNQNSQDNQQRIHILRQAGVAPPLRSEDAS